MPITLDGTLGITTPALTVTGATVNTGGISTAGNLTFSSTGQRIIGDFNNATLSNRLGFQTSTANSNTVVQAIPNGTNQTSGWLAFGSSDPNNSSYALVADTVGQVTFRAAVSGTGTYEPMTFYTNGAEKMRLTTAGNLGIGNTAPATSLQIGNGTADSVIRFGATSNGYDIGRINASGQFVANATQASPYNVWIWQQSGTERMRIDSSGQVGIYNTGPSSSNLLTVGSLNGVTRANVVTIQGSSTVDNYGNCIEFGHSNSAGYRSTLGAFVGNGSPFIGLECEGGTTGNTFRTRGIAGSVIYTDNAGAMLFGRVTSANADNQTVVESMRISSGGNVGIGLTSPGGKLDVYQEMRVSYANASVYYAGLTNTDGNTRLYANGDSAGLFFGSTAVGGTTATERMRIDNAGDIYITNATSKIIGGTTSGRLVFSNSDQTTYLIAYGSAYGGAQQSILSFVTASTKVTTINASGNLSLAGGTTTATGVGLTFPATQVASSDANCLDDYEEGTWTPTKGAGMTTTGTYTSSGSYVKVGQMVTIQGQASATTIAITSSSIFIAGLPFTVTSNGGGLAVGGYSNQSNTLLRLSYIGSNNLYNIGGASSGDNQIYFSATYQTSV